jgi:multicomponent Na+:H+ antiporter subunit B
MKPLDVTIRLVFFILFFSFLAYFVLGLAPIGSVRPLGQFYLNYTFSSANQTWWSSSPNAVTGMLWDYRGFDTLFETMVFFIGVAAVCAFFEHSVPPKGKGGMSLIVRTSTKLVYIFILTSALAMTVFSVKTSGGGFQGGAIIGIAYVSVLVALSRDFMPKLNMSPRKARMVQAIGLTLIATFAVVPILFSITTGLDAYALQNLQKDWSPFGWLPFWGLQSLSGGNIIPIQMGEMLTVGMGFTVIFLLYSYTDHGRVGEEVEKVQEDAVAEEGGG